MILSQLNHSNFSFTQQKIGERIWERLVLGNVQTMNFELNLYFFAHQFDDQ